MSYRGLELTTNLSEPLQDNQSLINLGGPGIDEDLGLFVNNLRNSSTLQFDPNDTDAGIIASSDGDEDRRFLFGRSVPFTFTNGDKVTIEVTSQTTGDVVTQDLSNEDSSAVVEYFIVDFEFGLGESESQRGFGLSESKNGSPVDLSVATGHEVFFTRKDPVTQRNILNIATPNINNSAENLGFALSGGRDFFSYNVSGNFNSELENIESNINQANFRRRSKYSVTRSIGNDDQIEIAGTLRVDDPANALTSDDDFDNPTVPGVFITDPFSDINDIEKTRAFSTLGNPWDENAETSSLDTPSSQVNIGDLEFEGDLRVNGLAVDEYETVNSADFTHKIPVNVGGVEYSLLVKST